MQKDEKCTQDSQDRDAYGKKAKYYICIYIYVYMYMRIYIYIYIYVRIYIYIYIRINLRIYKDEGRPRV